MRLYVESNFILEIALYQAEAEAALEIMQQAATDRVELAVPQFALCEPITTVHRRQSERLKFAKELEDIAAQVGRSVHHQKLAQQARVVVQLLREDQSKDMDRLERTLRDLAAVATTVPVDSSVLERALEYRDSLGVSRLQDAIMLASVIGHIHADPVADARFVTTDGHFADRAVKAELDAHRCGLIRSFVGALDCITKGQVG